MSQRTKFKNVSPGARFKQLNYPNQFTKLTQPTAGSLGCDACKTPSEEVWNASNGHNTVHFCPNEIVELLPAG